MFLFYKEEMVKMLFLGIVCKLSSTPAISALAPYLSKKRDSPAMNVPTILTEYLSAQPQNQYHQLGKKQFPLASRDSLIA